MSKPTESSNDLPQDVPLELPGRRGQREWRELQLRQLPEVGPAIDAVMQAMTAYGYASHDQFGVQLTLHEALTNGIRHGNGLDPNLTVRLRYALTHYEFLAEVEDEGNGFDPSQLNDPTDDGQLERCGGRGVFLMRRYMTLVRFNERGNCVQLMKRRGRKAAC